MRLSVVPAASTKSCCLVAKLILILTSLNKSNFKQWPAVCLELLRVGKKKKKKKKNKLWFQTLLQN